MKQLKFNPNKDMKELEKYGFEEGNNGYYRNYNSGFQTFINKLNREIFDIEITETQLIVQNEVTRANDLIKADLVEKVEECIK